MNICDIRENSDKLFPKGDNLVIRFLDWVLSQYLSKEDESIQIKAN